MAATIRELSCADDYDPNSMPVDKARAFISKFLAPITVTERLRSFARRWGVVAKDIISPIDVPGHDNSAMDGWAYRHRTFCRRALIWLPFVVSLSNHNIRSWKRVGTSYAGKPYLGPVGRGECVRIFTGAVMPPIATPWRCRNGHGGRCGRAPAERPEGRAEPPFRGEDLKTGAIALPKGTLIGPAAVGLLASLGVAEVDVYRKLVLRSFPPATN